jgi:hypothetical protein
MSAATVSAAAPSLFAPHPRGRAFGDVGAIENTTRSWLLEGGAKEPVLLGGCGVSSRRGWSSDSSPRAPLERTGDFSLCQPVGVPSPGAGAARADTAWAGSVLTAGCGTPAGTACPESHEEDPCPYAREGCAAWAWPSPRPRWRPPPRFRRRQPPKITGTIAAAPATEDTESRGSRALPDRPDLRDRKDRKDRKDPPDRKDLRDRKDLPDLPGRKDRRVKPAPPAPKDPRAPPGLPDPQAPPGRRDLPGRKDRRVKPAPPAPKDPKALRAPPDRRSPLTSRPLASRFRLARRTVGPPGVPAE